MGSEKKARLLRRLLLIIIIVCLIGFTEVCFSSLKHKRQQEKLNYSLETGDALQYARDAYANTEGMLPGFEELYNENNDLTGWLSIEGTGIDYPVLQCGDDEYYLNHDFYGREDKYGCLFVKGRADVNTPDTNVVIYGHSMKDGSMFGSLDEYESEKFYKEHPLINFSTLYERRTYEIVAAFLSQVYEKDETVFKYYQFYQADTEEEFLDFYENIKALSLYDTGVTAEFGDTFITLSTCSYHAEDGRFVIVAKRQEEKIKAVKQE